MDSPLTETEVWQGPLLVLVWAMAVGVLLWGSGVDVAVQVWLWDNYHQGFNDAMRYLGEVGKGTMQAGICLVVALGWLGWSWWRHKAFERKVMLVLGAVPVFVLASAVNWVLKVGIGRGRPKEFLMNGMGAYEMHPLTMKATWWSFPSGHSCSTFAIAVWLMLVFPRWKWVFLAVAVVMGVSRFLAVTPHFAGDVVAGAGVGAAVAMLVWRMTGLQDYRITGGTR